MITDWEGSEALYVHVVVDPRLEAVGAATSVPVMARICVDERIEHADPAPRAFCPGAVVVEERLGAVVAEDEFVAEQAESKTGTASAQQRTAVTRPPGRDTEGLCACSRGVFQRDDGAGHWLRAPTT